MATIIKHTIEMHPMALLKYLKANSWGQAIKDSCNDMSGNCIGEVDCDTGIITIYLPDIDGVSLVSIMMNLPDGLHTEVVAGTCSIGAYQKSERISDLLAELK